MLPFGNQTSFRGGFLGGHSLKGASVVYCGHLILISLCQKEL